MKLADIYKSLGIDRQLVLASPDGKYSPEIIKVDCKCQYGSEWKDSNRSKNLPNFEVSKNKCIVYPKNWGFKQ